MCLGSSKAIRLPVSPPSSTPSIRCSFAHTKPKMSGYRVFPCRPRFSRNCQSHPVVACSRWTSSGSILSDGYLSCFWSPPPSVSRCPLGGFVPYTHLRPELFAPVSSRLPVCYIFPAFWGHFGGVYVGRTQRFCDRRRRGALRLFFLDSWNTSVSSQAHRHDSMGSPWPSNIMYPLRWPYLTCRDITPYRMRTYWRLVPLGPERLRSSILT